MGLGTWSQQEDWGLEEKRGSDKNNKQTKNLNEALTFFIADLALVRAKGHMCKMQSV